MALVQLAVKSVHDPPQEEVKAVYWGLDVVWDLYLAAGTIGFSLAFLRSVWFRAWYIPGIVIACALVVLNVVAFPEPPGSAGLVDVGPLVGLWYTTVTLRAMHVLWTARNLP